MNKPNHNTANYMTTCLLGFCFFSDHATASMALSEWNMQTRLALPVYLKVWLGAMLLMHFCSLFFVKRFYAARWILGCFIASHIIVFYLENSATTTLLAGMVSLSHVIFWPPALYAVYHYRQQLSRSLPYKLWIGSVIFFYSVSLVFDIRDSAIYLYHAL
ncbi:hypothetical protein R50073_01500 [Maricurvus nonylphenolicus]|uniref:hypothetical protein n=1 Tax=Maricurvus nonylphenolicus TaxID=1008307 RepID=UPI0036F23687